MGSDVHHRPTHHPTLPFNVILLLICLSAARCDQETTPGGASTTADSSPGMGEVRVLVARGADAVRLHPEDGIDLRDGSDDPLPSPAGAEPLIIEPGPAGGFLMASRPVEKDLLVIRPSNGEELRISFRRAGDWRISRSLPGSVHLIVNGDGLIDAVNLVDVETYVACVTANEVWPDFETEACRAQAIVARTFVLFQMGHRRNAAYDVVSTEASQVYRGIRRDEVGLRAAQAAEYTRGVVCAFKDGSEYHLFSTYYHAACGGHTQSAAVFGPANEVPPLAGGVQCDHCKIAPKDTYRWGPVRIAASDVIAELAERDSRFAEVGAIGSIEVTEQTRDGRAIRLRVHGLRGEVCDIPAERFRLAVGSRVMRSTACRISVEGGEIIFSEGKGFGHGMGLCQWGMEGQARQGKTAGEILRYYYPGSSLQRAY